MSGVRMVERGRVICVCVCACFLLESEVRTHRSTDRHSLLLSRPLCEGYPGLVIHLEDLLDCIDVCRSPQVQTQVVLVGNAHDLLRRQFWEGGLAHSMMSYRTRMQKSKKCLSSPLKVPDIKLFYQTPLPLFAFVCSDHAYIYGLCALLGVH